MAGLQQMNPSFISCTDLRYVSSPHHLLGLAGAYVVVSQHGEIISTSVLISVLVNLTDMSVALVMAPHCRASGQYDMSPSQSV